ncbi:MAG: sigma-70 family RNA polymerase sigma factor [Myxococcota bacterium]
MTSVPHLTLVPAPAGGSLGDRADDDLMRLARSGERGAFEALVRRHQGKVLGLALKVLGDEALARDAAQDSFVDLMRALATYRPEGRFPQFLYRVALNRCRMVARSLRIERRAQERAWREDCEGEALAPDDVLARERQRELSAAMQALVPAQRELLALRFFADLPHDEIAEVLEIPVGTVKSRLHAAVAALRATFGEALP